MHTCYIYVCINSKYEVLVGIDTASILSELKNKADMYT